MADRDSLIRGLQMLAGIILCESVGLIAGFATRTSVSTWYPTLAKPSFTPPDWLFAPMWILLYALMGIAMVLVWWRWSRDGSGQWALILFGVQLVLNGLWSFAFFGMHSVSLGLVVIVGLWIVLAWTTERFFCVRADAGWLLVPYLAWVTYAAALNGALWVLN